ncbi:MAG: MBL fold metallo-hydrolase [Limisphaerales bacterium]
MPKTLEQERSRHSYEHVTPHVARVPHQLVNSYLVDDPISGQWILVDAGLRTSTNHILRAAMERFGSDSRPVAIVLTHGHFDHVGALGKLSEFWEVPVYAHTLEFPYLNGCCAYPPPDPTVGGGMMSVMSRFLTRGPYDFSKRLRPLPSNGEIPGMPGWRWLATPGHSPGHISLFYEAHRTLIAGDAFVTTKQESVLAILSQQQEVNGPPAYFTCDWESARNSVRVLASLNPRVAATGHGIPMSGEELAAQLQKLADNFERDAIPKHGRYVGQPAITDENGVISVPPPASDPWRKAAAVGIGVLTIGAFALLVRANRRKHCCY